MIKKLMLLYLWHWVYGDSELLDHDVLRFEIESHYESFELTNIYVRCRNVKKSALILWEIFISFMMET